MFWASGTEDSIADVITDSAPVFAAGGGPSASVPVGSWTGGPPAVDDPWAMVPPLAVITPAPPATGFTNAAGLVVA